VARRAGVGKPTIYRRWRNKAFLTHDAVYPGLDDMEIVWDTGDVAADLRRHIDNMVMLFSQPASVAAAPALLAEFGAHPELRDALWERLEIPARRGFVAMVEAAQQRGQVRADLDADTLFHALAGSVLWQACALGTTAGAGFEAHLCDLVLRGVLPPG
jgi:AcrR family transcriptional regulator